MGSATAVTRTTLMDATEAIMRAEGYAAVTSRHVARQAGVNQQTLYYYFQTMDDLLLETYRRRTGRMLADITQALASKLPLRSLWQFLSQPGDAALTMEYLALSNHNDQIRRESVEFGERIRAMQIDVLGKQHPLAPGDPKPSAFAMTMGINYIAHLLGFEAALGLQGGHEAARTLVEWCLQQFEPAARPAEFP